MQCPFVQCQKDGAYPIVPHVFLCPDCRRLALACDNPACKCLNRPFMAHCRRCSQSLRGSDTLRSSEELWRRAAHGDANLPDVPSEWPETQSEILFELAKLPGARGIDVATTTSMHLDSQPRIAMSWVHGLLALHQGGGIVALIHPFRAANAASGHDYAVAWSKPELPRCPTGMRPFPPVALGDGRHLLFSHPGAAFCVDTWSLGDWTFNSPTKYERIGALDERQQLAATPVALGEHTVGFLLIQEDADERRYFWAVVDIRSADTWHHEPQPLPLRGAPCQILLANSHAVIFATPLGHWTWTWDDAATANLPALQATWRPAQEGEHLVLNDDLVRHRDFDFPQPRQVLLATKPPRPRMAVQVYFTVRQRAHSELYYYDFNAESARASTPRPVDGASGAVPLGEYTEPGSSLPLMAVAVRNHLKRVVGNGERLEPMPHFGAIEMVAHASGLLFSDPWYVNIGTSHQDLRTIVARSLRFPEQDARLRLSLLAATPVVWNQWLFALECWNETAVLRRHSLLNLLNNESVTGAAQ